MKAFKKEKIDFMSGGNFLLINYSGRILTALLLISLVVGIISFRLIIVRSSLQDELTDLEERRLGLTGIEEDYTGLKEQKTLPQSYFNAAVTALNLLEGRGYVEEFSFAHPLLLLRGRAQGEAELQEIIMEAAVMQSGEFDITLLRLDYRSEPSFTLELRCGGDQNE